MAEPGAEQRWEYSLSAKRYRDTTTGRFVSQASIEKLREDFVAARQDVVRDLVAQLEAGDITVQEWLSAMRDEVKLAHIGQYLFGRGGRNAMTDDDWAAVSDRVRQQFEPLQTFAEQVAAGTQSADQIANRSANYIDTSRASYAEGHAVAHGWPDLPAYPADGSTQCYANCRCFWTVEPVEGGWDCTWNLGEADHCDDCIERSEEWAPLFIAAPEQQAA
jgi:hypothetical protein